MPRPQKHRDECDAEELADRDEGIARFVEAVTYGNYYEDTKRYGSITFPWRPNNDNGNGGYDKFQDHQVIGAWKVCCGDDRPYDERKFGLIALYDMGMGKTIYAMALWAGIDVACVPEGMEGKSLFIVPKTLITQWAETIDNWIDCTSNFTEAQKKVRGSGVLIARSRKDLTLQAILHAKIVVTSPDAIAAAYRTYMKRVKVPDRRKNGTPYERWTWQRKHSKQVHPFFGYMNRSNGGHRAWTLVVMDELPYYCNPQSNKARLVRECCTNAVYTVPLTGRPGRARPRQMADMARTADLYPTRFWDPKEWHKRGFQDKKVRKETVVAFHDQLVDRVTEKVVWLPPVTKTVIRFSPKVGRMPDGSFKQEYIQECNEYLRGAQHAANAVLAGGGAGNAAEAARLNGRMWKGISKMVNYSADSTLGHYGGKAFKDDPYTCRREALTMTSEHTKLVHRMVRHHQSQGAARIVLYSIAKQTLQILMDYLRVQGDCGRLCNFVGGMTDSARKSELTTFLTAPKSVLFMSKAGSTGTNIAPGCHTIFIVGDMPYNNTDVDQAIARLRRCNQPRDVKIEAVFFEPFDSIISKKIEQHVDKRDRLEMALNDNDFSNFINDVPGGDELWRRSASIVTGLTPAGEDPGPDTGDFAEAACIGEMRRKHAADRRAAQTAGRPMPPTPAELSERDGAGAHVHALAADVPLPPVLFPVEGFVEVQGYAPSDSEDDDPVFEGYLDKPEPSKRTKRDEPSSSSSSKKKGKQTKTKPSGSGADRKAALEAKVAEAKKQLYQEVAEDEEEDAFIDDKAETDDEGSSSEDEGEESEDEGEESEDEE